jgi:hypothetical protein
MKKKTQHTVRTGHVSDQQIVEIESNTIPIAKDQSCCWLVTGTIKSVEVKLVLRAHTSHLIEMVRSYNVFHM